MGSYRATRETRCAQTDATTDYIKGDNILPSSRALGEAEEFCASHPKTKMAESEQQQQDLNNRTPDVGMTAWMEKQMTDMENELKAGRFQQALDLVQEGLAVIKQHREVRHWELLLLRRRAALEELGRPEKTPVAQKEADRICETNEESSNT